MWLPGDIMLHRPSAQWKNLNEDLLLTQSRSTTFLLHLRPLKPFFFFFPLVTFFALLFADLQLPSRSPDLASSLYIWTFYICFLSLGDASAYIRIQASNCRGVAPGYSSATTVIVVEITKIIIIMMGMMMMMAKAMESYA